ncbi:uncharacterized protein LOC141659979 [Apium graveolens]|uniref:uncharacterized protein LOC141659979 n=1 Tax=Apium graveolens TaxID=4045 RepID=UPI003D78E68F
MIEFFMEHVVFRFGVPRILVFENGTQFAGAQFKKASVACPQASGIKELTNRTILQGLKKRNEKIPRCWVDELPNMLWSYRTTLRSATGKIPFYLAYGVDVVLPVKISLISPSVEEKTAKYFNMKVKDKNLNVNDLVLRDFAASQPTVTGKFKPTWEGPYVVSKVVSAGTYELAHLDGQLVKKHGMEFISRNYISDSP